MTNFQWMGERIRLATPDLDADAPVYQSWCYNTAFKRLSSAAASTIVTREQLEGWMQGQAEDTLDWMIHTLEDDRLVGRVGLEEFGAFPSNGWLSIEIGDPKDWNCGYGSEATRLVLRHGFAFLNLQRISLAVAAFNERAIHVYEKFGFVEEGRQREMLDRDGMRWDLVFMGLLRDEWVEA